MKGKKLLAGILSAAMVLGTMAIPAFAGSDTDIYEIGTDKAYVTIAEAVEAAEDKDNDGSITYKIYGKVNLAGKGWFSPVKVNGETNAQVTVVNFVGADESAEIVIDTDEYTALGPQGSALKYINYSNLICSRPAGKWVADLGHGNNYFISTLRNREKEKDGVVTYENCTFPNGCCNNFYGKTEYKDCTFNNENNYCLWLYGGDTTVSGTKNIFTGAKGVKLYAETASEPVNAKIENSKFKISGKPAVVASTWGKLELNDVDANDNDCPLGLLASEPNNHGTGNPYAEIKVDGKEPVYVAKVGECVFTDKSGALDEAENDESKLQPVVSAVEAKNGVKYFSTLAEAVEAAESGDTVTLLKDANGDGIIINSAAHPISNLTIDFGGFTYTVDGVLVGSGGSETNGFQLLAQKDEKGNYVAPDITFKHGTIRSSKKAQWGSGGSKWNYGVMMLIQNYSNLILEDMNLDGNEKGASIHNPHFVISNNNGHTVMTGNTNITAATGRTAFDVCAFKPYPSVSVTLDENMTGTIKGKVEFSNSGKIADLQDDFNLIIKNGTIVGNFVDKRTEEQKDVNFGAISGGSFTADVSGYCADGYALKKDGSMYVAGKSSAKVINKAEAVSTTITLNNLERNLKTDDSIDFRGDENAVYEVVVSEPSAADKTVIPEKEDVDNKAEMYDIKVVKTVGETTTVVDVKNQQVTLDLGSAVKSGETPIVKHIKDGAQPVDITVESVSGDGKSITFTAPSFSTYYVEYPAVDPAASEIATNLEAKLENEVISGKTATYDLVLYGGNDRVINRFMSSEWKFDCSGNVSYEVTPAVNVKMTQDTANDIYGLNMDGKNYADATGKKIKLATVTITGIGDYTFNAASAKAHTAKAANNIVDSFDSAATAATGKVVLGAGVTGTLETAKYNLSVNIVFNNIAENQVKAYQQMKAVISGGDLTDDIVIDLGSDAGTGVVYNQYLDNTAEYKFSAELSENETYTVTVSGAGYRTARYTVNMTGDKTLNFWNNVKSTAERIEAGVGTPKTSNFLAGDIVKDNKINIYDLSAVVSYFGVSGLDAANHPEYAQYDLNRDGKIDSRDVAYVLVSWDN